MGQSRPYLSVLFIPPLSLFICITSNFSEHVRVSYYHFPISPSFHFMLGRTSLLVHPQDISAVLCSRPRFQQAPGWLQDAVWLSAPTTPRGHGVLPAGSGPGAGSLCSARALLGLDCVHGHRLGVCCHGSGIRSPFLF